MRKWARLLTAGILVALAGLYPLLAPPPHRIDQAHFERITNGMTREQVESMFGVPAGEYDWAEHDSFSLVQTNVNVIANEVWIDEPMNVFRVLTDTSTWTSRAGAFTVAFGGRDRVRVTWMSPDVRIVPPWQRWWRNWKK